MNLLIEIGTSLTLPVLAHYWSPDDQFNSHFLGVLKALVAYIIFRRVNTGGTDGIDKELRELSSWCRSDKSPKELKKRLQVLLDNKILKFEKNSWVERISRLPLYVQAKVVVRFMIFMAAHKAVRSSQNPGTWETVGIPSEEEADYLNLRVWNSLKYKTIEHVAPSTECQEWSSQIYSIAACKDSLGNLILLPSEINSSIGNSNWRRKKELFKALAMNDQHAVDQWMESQASKRVRLPKALEKQLGEKERFALLEPLQDVEDWNVDMIERRGQNIASNCWDVLSAWLDT